MKGSRGVGLHRSRMRLTILAIILLFAFPSVAAAHTWNFSGTGGLPSGWRAKFAEPSRAGGKLEFELRWKDGEVYIRKARLPPTPSDRELAGRLA